MMKTFSAFLVLMMVAVSTQASTSDSVAVKVTISSSVSVNITEDTIQLGSIAAGSTKVSTTAATVNNDGSGVNETYSLSLTNPSGWTASQTVPGNNSYVLNAAFSSTSSGLAWSAANHALSTTPVVCSASKFSGNQTGVSVPLGSVRNLWFQLLAPTSTNVSTEQSISVIVTAQAG